MEKKISDLTVTEFMALMQACLDADRTKQQVDKAYWDYANNPPKQRAMTDFEKQVNDYYNQRQNQGMKGY